MMLKLVDHSGQVIAAFAPNDAIVDTTGSVIARVDWKIPEVIVGDESETLKFDRVPEGISVATPTGELHATVDGTGELHVNGTSVGSLVGFDATDEEWRHLAALVFILPIVPKPAPVTPRDASMDALDPPPPPPPPPPRHPNSPGPSGVHS